MRARDVKTFETVMAEIVALCLYDIGSAMTLSHRIKPLQGC